MTQDEYSQTVIYSKDVNKLNETTLYRSFDGFFRKKPCI